MSRSHIIRPLLVLAALAVPRLARAQTTWDLVHIAGANGDLGGNSYTFNLGAGYGSITAFTNTLGGPCGFGEGALVFCFTDVGATGYDNPLPDPSKGIGLLDCEFFISESGFGGECPPDAQIGGSSVDNSLWLDVSGLAPGVLPQFLTLAALDPGDAWQVQFSTSSTCNTATVMDGSSFAGTGAAYGGAYANFAFAGSTCVKISDTGDLTDPFVLQSLTTLGAPAGGPGIVTPEPGTLSLLTMGMIGLVGAARRSRKRIA